MSRKEIVLLVSRAIALLQIIAALMDCITLIPEISMLFREWTLFAAIRTPPPGFRGTLPPSPIGSILGIGLLANLLHIGVLLFLAALFWNCGPRVERWLAPASVEQEQ